MGKAKQKKVVWGIGDVRRFWMIPNWSYMIKGVTHAHLGPIWYRSEPSDVPYSKNQFLGWDFFGRFLQQDSSSWICKSWCWSGSICAIVNLPFLFWHGWHAMGHGKPLFSFNKQCCFQCSEIITVTIFISFYIGPLQTQLGWTKSFLDPDQNTQFRCGKSFLVWFSEKQMSFKTW